MIEILILDYEYPEVGVMERIHPVIIRDKKHTVLVDCGPQGTFDILEASLRASDVNPEAITHVILTHHDQDHMGNLYELKENYPDVIVVASKREEPFISGKVELERLTSVREKVEAMSVDDQASYFDFVNLLESIKPVPVDEIIKPNDIYDVCGGLTILDTKGHTSGHISILLKHMDTLVAGDAAFLVNRRLETSPDFFTIHKKDAQASLEYIKSLNVQTIICYHGGVL